MKTIPATLLALSLCACATSQQRHDAIANDAMAQCVRMGYVAQSPEWRACAQQLYFATVQADDARRAQAVRDFTATAAAIATQPPPPAPTPAVMCRQTYAGVICQ